MVSSPEMPVVAAPLFGLSLGVLFAWAGAEEIARASGAATSRSLIVALLFGLLVYAPACGYFPAFFPDWSYAYLLDAERRPVALDMLIVLSCALSPAAGLSALARAAASRRDRALARGAAIPGIVAAAFLVALLPRLRIYGTYAEFHGDFGTEALTGSPVGYALIWMSVVVLGAAAWTVRLLRAIAQASNAN
jgi:hypothetical protein